MDSVQKIDGKTFFSLQVAARRLGMTPAALSARCRKGEYEARKISGRWFVVVPMPSERVKAKVQKKTATKPRSKSVASTSAIATPLPTRIVERVVASVPTKPLPRIPALYVKSLPMIIGVVTAIALVIGVSWNSTSGTTQGFAGTITRAGTHVAAKSAELAEHISLAAGVGASAVTTRVASLARDTSVERPTTADAHPSSLARTIAHGKRTDARLAALSGAHMIASAVSSLYVFEFLDTSSQ